ncbi:toxin-antitoxin system YwqK family antitoxin [Neisseria sp. Ec49-e6-T10]|uniref:toxin-antitoxin system YwqK family antitoxin n=1 Tax=Neisseria sp. Ec49-e6-T10 TaxID=3140744 RepID=UPI003EBD50FA
MIKYLSLAMIFLLLNGCDAINEKFHLTNNKISDTEVVSEKENKILAYFPERDLLNPSVKKSDNFYYRKLLGKNKNGDYVVQHFYKSNQKKLTDPIIIKEQNDLLKEEPLSINGLRTIYAETGEKTGEGWLFNGKPNGYFVRWHKNGKKFLEKYFINGQQYGITTIWFENGQKLIEGMMINGKAEGLYVTWDEDGQKATEARFVNGKENGVGRMWIDGKLRRQTEYKDNQLHGRSISWHKNGVKASELTYINDKPAGVGIIWDENGNKEIEKTYKDGKVIKKKCYKGLEYCSD